MSVISSFFPFVSLFFFFWLAQKKEKSCLKIEILFTPVNHITRSIIYHIWYTHTHSPLHCIYVAKENTYFNPYIDVCYAKTCQPTLKLNRVKLKLARRHSLYLWFNFPPSSSSLDFSHAIRSLQVTLI